MPSATANDHARTATASAWLVVLVLGIVTAAIIIWFAFTGDNVRASVDGRSATTSQFIDGE